MITQALLHCPGIGPARLARLHALEIRSWYDVLAAPDVLPPRWRAKVTEECQRCVEAYERRDVGYFARRLAPADRWRILWHFLDQISFFDIETAGLNYDDPITVIACWHQGQLHTFVEHENLDSFLGLLEDVVLLGSFNGSSFDVPRVLSTFHIPELPCAHVDLRWLSYQLGYRGGLKEVTRRLGIVRPADLEDADGSLAVRLWARWQHFQDRAARDQLVRYCASDALLLRLLADRFVGRTTTGEEQMWGQLPAPRSSPQIPPVCSPTGGALRGVSSDGPFGRGSPLRLRGRRIAS